MRRLFFAFIVRELAAQRVRTLTTLAGIALGIAVVLAIQLAAASALTGFEEAVDSTAGRASLEITQPPLGIDEQRLPQLRWLQDVGQVTPIVEGEATWRASSAGAENVRGLPAEAAGEGRQAALLHVLGVDILTDRAFRDYAFAAAGPRTPETANQFLRLLTDAKAVVLTAKFAAPRGIRVGDTVQLSIGERVHALTVRALLADRGPARAMNGHIVLMDIAAAQLALGRLGRVDRLEVRLANRADLDRVETTLAGALGSDFVVQRPERRGRQVEQMLAAFHANLTALSAIALIAGVFLVYNTVSTSVVARRQEIGMLRALGASRLGVFALFIGEALLLAAPGCVLGIALGRYLAQGAVALTSSTVSRMYVSTGAAPVTLDWMHVGLAFAIGLPLAAIAALAPALEAARVPPTVAIRHTLALTPDRWRARLAIGLTSIALAVWLCTLDPIGGLPLAGYLAAFCVVVATAASTAPLLTVIARGLAHVTRRLPGVSARLAAATLVEYAQRLSISVAALAVSLAMTVAIAVMVGSFRETVVYWVGQTLVADLFVGPASRRAGAQAAVVPASVEAIVRAHPQVAAVDTFRTLTSPYGGSQIFIGGGDFRVLVDHGRLQFKAPSRATDAVRAAAAAGDVVVSEAFALRYRHTVGDRVELRTAHGPRSFRIAAIYYDYSSDRGTVVFDTAAFARWFDDRRPGGLSVYLEPGARPDVVREELLAQLGAASGMMVNTNGALRTEVLRIFDRTFAITWALELVAITVAVLGIVATLVTLIVERRRELAVLRLVGAERWQIRRMVVIESAIVGGVSQLIGLGVGIALSLVLVYVINVQSFGWSIQFHLPLAVLAQLSLLLILATAAAGVFPAERAARTFLTEPHGDN
jgi:putative ABC transport system permease protein